MLNPDSRSIYTSALTPPPGMVFDEGLGTTFSLDPTTLLSIPVHMTLLARVGDDQISDGIPVLESIRRLSDRITIYAQRGRLQVPNTPNVLYGLLERMICEVNAPRGGQFHPKIWLMKFVDPDNEIDPCIRLIVLSRNITADKSWDVSLRLEGKLGDSEQPTNRDISALISSLPEISTSIVTSERAAQAERLAFDLLRTSLELPPGFDEMSITVLGMREGAWEPPSSGRLAVISPFLADHALSVLSKKTKKGAILVSRTESLEGLREETIGQFSRSYTLCQEAETDDGESLDNSSSSDMLGLHAKVYVLESGWDTHIVVGSGNATNAALTAASNVEVMVDLVGKRRRVGSIDTLLGDEGIGPYLMPFSYPDVISDVDSDLLNAERALDSARRILAHSEFMLKCAETDDPGLWSLQLQGSCPDMDGIVGIRAWPITISEERCVTIFPQGDGDINNFGPLTLSAVTGLIAFELITKVSSIRARLVLNIEISGLPENRDSEIYRSVLRNKDDFFRYLLILLNGEDPGRPSYDGNKGYGTGGWEYRLMNGTGLLEELTRAYSTEPERLDEVDKIIRSLVQSENANEVVTDEFLDLWKVFEEALSGKSAS